MTLLPEFLPVDLRQEPSAAAEVDADESPVGDIDWQILPQFVEKAISGNETDVYRRARDQFDRLLIIRAVQHTGGNQNRAAEILGLSRVTLRARLRAMKELPEQSGQWPPRADPEIGRPGGDSST
jgi:two-component system nitrogen regulation response regulator GlnG